jgi:hypothetical protein
VSKKQPADTLNRHSNSNRQELGASIGKRRREPVRAATQIRNPRRRADAPGDAFMIPFSVVLTIVMIAQVAPLFDIERLQTYPEYWFAAAVAVYFGAVSALAGLYLVFSRFVYDIKLRASMQYLVTERRIVIASEVLKRQITSIDLSLS